MKDLSNRMKKYECTTRYYLTKRVPVILRLDGNTFHTLTRKCEKPFDKDFMACMCSCADVLRHYIQGFKLAYVQSDEINILITDYDSLETEGWFDYNLSKVISISAGITSAHFSSVFKQRIGWFDCRAFNIPEDDVSNYFVWRAKDWERNSLQMYARSFFSHKQLMNRNSSEIHEMLYSIGKNWSKDLTNQQKNGTYFTKNEVRSDILPKYEMIENLWRNKND